MKKIIIATFVFTMLILTGCATIISGTNQTLTFNSDVEDVDVYVDGALIGKTPVSASFKKNKVQTVMFKKEGYRAVTREITKSFDPITLGSFFWDLSTTDFITGAVYEYAPNAIYVEMPKKEEKSAE
ncbi:PEGA domain-containing protein [Marinomonas colpomeniae]|uniref:PEGA domain-containing protein n=1 Tax=Marinomonas colpomeniae TaxID=2774408 RepID=A0ABR8NZR0_9GAMM|nr:PEGA domain-containing protein [Marinomonas colpomeniae]MBD5771540.1 PEGA domain-containing protein [Marinomonas colpomeniae]